MKPSNDASWDGILGHIIDARLLCMGGAHRAPRGPGESQGSPKEAENASMKFLVLPAAPRITSPQCQLGPLAPTSLGTTPNPSTSPAFPTRSTLELPFLGAGWRKKKFVCLKSKEVCVSQKRKEIDGINKKPTNTQTFLSASEHVFLRHGGTLSCAMGARKSLWDSPHKI